MLLIPFIKQFTIKYIGIKYIGIKYISVNYLSVNYLSALKIILLWLYMAASLLISGCSTIHDENSTHATIKDNNHNNAGVNRAGSNKADSNRVDNKAVSNKHIKTQKIIGNSTKENIAKVSNAYIEQAQIKMIGVPLTVIDTYREAVDLLKQKKWQAAQVLFDKVIKQQPHLAGSYVNKAIIAKQQNQLTAADKLVDKALSLNNENPYAHHLKGQLLTKQGQFIKAEQSYLKALTIWPDYGQAQVNLAILLELYRGKLQEAFHYYQRYLAVHDSDRQVQRWLAGLKIKLTRAGIEPIISTDSISKPLVKEDKHAL